MPLTIELTNTRDADSGRIPLEVDGITPDQVSELPVAGILKRPIYFGNRQIELGDFFRITGDPSDREIVWQGDLSCVHWLGKRMRWGRMTFESSVGRHLGSEMAGGSIEVAGDASDWVGGEMSGGSIHVAGSAGHLVGAAYRGSSVGMRGGSILIEGAAGNETGHTMRRGLIAIGGDAGDLTAFNMLAGTVLVIGTAGNRVGAGMRRGTVILYGDQQPAALPTFRRACRIVPEILGVVQRQLMDSFQFEPAVAIAGKAYDIFNGDLLNGGRGELFVRSGDAD